MIRVALLFGGRSSEHSISCATAGGVLGAIDRSRFEVVPIGITKDGAFTLQDPDVIAGFALGAELPAISDNGTRVHFPESAASREFTVTEGAGRAPRGRSATSMSRSPSCTGPSARTAPSRACSS